MSKKNGRFVWTPAITKKYRDAIKAERETYATIAEKLKITPQTVWAQLHKEQVKAWRGNGAKRAKRAAKAKTAKGSAKVVKLTPKGKKAA